MRITYFSSHQIHGTLHLISTARNGQVARDPIALFKFRSHRLTRHSRRLLLAAIHLVLVSNLVFSYQSLSAQSETSEIETDDPADIIDGNLVNVITGKVSFKSVELNIGEGGMSKIGCWSSGGWQVTEAGKCGSISHDSVRSDVESANAPSLQLVRHWTGSPGIIAGNYMGNWTNNWMSSVAIGYPGKLTATFGTQTYAFANATKKSRKGDGATIEELQYGEYIVTTRDGTKIRYGPTFGPVTSITYSSGRVINITYATRQGCGNSWCMDFKYYRLQQVRSSDNLAIHFEYATDNSVADNISQWKQITRATGFNTLQVACPASQLHCSFDAKWPSVVYTESAGVMSSQMPGGSTTRYELQGGHITRIIDPNGQEAFEYLYGYYGTTSQKQHMVTGVQRGDLTWVYSPSPDNELATTASPMTVTDPAGQTRQYVGTKLEGLTSTADELGRMTTYQYDSFRRLTEVTYPAGNRAQTVYDDRGNVVESRRVAQLNSGQTDLVVTAGFETTCSNPATCNSPLWTADGKGNVTDYTYDTTHGGALTTIEPAAAPGLPRASNHYSYQQVLGTYRVSEIKNCMTLANCTGSADEVVQRFVYDTATGFLTEVSQASGVSGSELHRSCFYYGDVGELISSTAPSGAIGGCQ